MLLTQLIILTGSLALPYCGGNAGMYYQDRNVLAICIPEGTIAYDSTFKHEYGHYIYFRVLTHEQRKQYAILWERDKAHADRFSRTYSQVNVYEGFADDYAWIYFRKYLPKPNRYAVQRIKLIKSFLGK